MGGSVSEFNYGAIRSAEEFEKFVDRIIDAGKPFGFDIEAGFVGDPKEKDVALKFRHPNWVLVGFSFTNSEEWARYVPVAHDTGDNVDDPERTARALWRLLQTGLGVAHNALYELGGLSRWFRDIIGDDPEVKATDGFFPLLSDSMIESFLVACYDPLRVGQGLKGLTKHNFDHQMVEFKSLFEELIANKTIKSTQMRFNILELTPEVIEYACEDALWCLKLHLKHLPMLQRMPVYNVVYKTEIALLPIVARMEYEGLLLNWEAISAKAAELETFKELMNEEIQQDLSDRLGETININLASVKQLSELLFEKLGIVPQEFSEKTNAPSTSEPALRAIAKEDPIIKRILEYREVTKLLGSYLRKYENELNYAGDGRAYPNHKQTGTTTGRFSVDGVSYQQWPKPYHYELGSGVLFDLNFRDLLVAPEEFRVVGFDFSQVELRVLAGAAQEKAMLEAFEQGIDIHTQTASKMLGIPLEDVTSKDRQLGKTVNFGLVYGSGASGLANLIGTTLEDAQAKLNQYFEAFPEIKKWMDEQVSQGKSSGYIENLFGRRIKIWEFLDTRKWMIAKGERFAGNAPIQGGAGDYLKIGMVRVDRAIKKAGLEDKIKMVITFHDALEFYVHESVSTQEFIDLIGPAVSFPLEGYPEILADWHEGYQWGSIADISLKDGQISGYSIGVVDTDKTQIKWEGDSLDEVLAPYYYWSKEHFGETYHDLDYFLSRVPAARDWVEEDAPVASPEPEVIVDTPVTITLSDMPTGEGWKQFREFLKTKPGHSEVTVVTPEGALTFDETYTVSSTDQGKISLLLGGATLSFPTGDTENLLEGIEL